MSFVNAGEVSGMIQDAFLLMEWLQHNPITAHLDCEAISQGINTFSPGYRVSEEFTSFTDDALFILVSLRYNSITTYFDCDVIGQAVGMSGTAVKQEIERIRDAYNLNIAASTQGDDAAGVGGSDKGDDENNDAGAEGAAAGA